MLKSIDGNNDIRFRSRLGCELASAGYSSLFRVAAGDSQNFLTDIDADDLTRSPPYKFGRLVASSALAKNYHLFTE